MLYKLFDTLYRNRKKDNIYFNRVDLSMELFISAIS